MAQSYRIAQEEIFGPVLTVLTFRTPEEAVEKANNTPYGLSAGVWTEKGSRILWMAEQLRAGVVWANTFNRFDPASPFGGYKESGFGREGGRHGLEPYLAFDSGRDGRDPARAIATRTALAALDRATWSSLSSPAPRPAAIGPFFDERTRPGTCSSRLRRRRGRRLREARPRDAASPRATTC